MLVRGSLICLLTLVLLARGVHCLCVDVMLCGQAAAASGSDKPFADPAESDPNESGCLCKGALVSAPCTAAGLQAQDRLLSLLQLELSSPIFHGIATSRAAQTVEDHLWPPPRSASEVRALLASWQV